MSPAVGLLALAHLVLGGSGVASAASDLEQESLSLYEDYIRAESAADFDGLASLLDENFQAEMNGAQLPGRGPQVEIGMVRPVRAALPDYVVEVKQVIAQDDLIAAGWIIRGSHEGEGFGVSPTHRTVEIAGCTIFQVRNGKFARGFNYIDSGSVPRQLGVMRQLAIVLMVAAGAFGALIALAAALVRRRALAATQGRVAHLTLNGLVIVGALALFALLALGLLQWLTRSVPM